jgi:hypothetical protein
LKETGPIRRGGKKADYCRELSIWQFIFAQPVQMPTAKTANLPMIP